MALTYGEYLKLDALLKQQQVMSNPTYLIDNGWVKTFDVEKTVTVRGGTVPSAVTWYEITAKGIDKIEGGSQFEPKERYAGVNTHASGANIITLGDGNVVRAEYSNLREALDELKDVVLRAPALSDPDKLDIAVDIESIKDQLAKSAPSKTIVDQLWSGLGGVATVAGVADAFERVQGLIGGLLP